MPPDRSSFTALNIPNDTVPEWMGSFTLAAPPNTDLWRKPPSRDTSTAPILYTALRNPFIAAEVTVSADWELEWDQGGLVIFAGAPPAPIATRAVNATTAAVVSPTTTITTTATESSTTTTSSARTSATTTNASSGSTGSSAGQQQQQQSGVGAPAAPEQSDHRGAPPPAYTPPAPASKWVKVGLEFCNNACHATSVCATADGADWALTALPPHHARRLDLRVKIERIGYALWIWYEDDTSGWKKLREVTWFFWGVEDKAVRVGVYASRPANFGTTMYERRHGGPSVTQRNLCVDFEGLEIY
jgi:regulation of enolase protein 1 (concanavalin A-like superfamily)